MPAPLKIIVLCPHFEPDSAPTGAVMTRLVHELAGRGHELHVVTALPWYRTHAIEPGWSGRLSRRSTMPWGSVTRLHPFPGADKSNLARRALGFAGFSVLAGGSAVRAGGTLSRADVVLAMSPPLTLGLTGWLAGLTHRAPLVFNVQDVFPDAAVRTGAIRSRKAIAVASRLERATYRRARAVTVLSADLQRNVAAKLPQHLRHRVEVIPNFVDTALITPGDRMTSYRRELGIGDEPVVLYAGNLGYSQSLDLMVAAARRCPDITFVINGEGAARASLVAAADGVANIRFAPYQPAARLAEVLASGDVHVVPLRAGLGDVSVPSKTYSSLAAGRPVVAAIDLDSEIPRLLRASGGGVVVPPDDPEAFVAAIRRLTEAPEEAAAMASAGRRWVEQHASPESVATAYEALLRQTAERR